IDNLVLKDVKLPAQNDQEEKKIVQQQEDASKTAQEAAAKKEKDAERTEKTEESVYGNLVGRSSDGDTTRVKQGAMEALETGMVFAKDERENNLMEFNRDQLTVMVDKGDITENRYNHEITRRNELMEKDDKSAFAKSNAEMIEKQKEEAEKKAQEKARERLDEMQGKGTEKEENAQKLENGMNRLAASEKGLEIEEEAVENAAKNGRSEVIDQILNPEDGNFKVIIR
ncbi:MAG: hypothetical protein IJL90_02760, partial [Lachnospiraceae bacterium]|nr:hypothetical protein [Lachnospiraceae bacterium]